MIFAIPLGIISEAVQTTLVLDHLEQADTAELQRQLAEMGEVEEVDSEEEEERRKKKGRAGNKLRLMMKLRAAQTKANERQSDKSPRGSSALATARKAQPKNAASAIGALTASMPLRGRPEGDQLARQRAASADAAIED